MKKHFTTITLAALMGAAAFMPVSAQETTLAEVLGGSSLKGYRVTTDSDNTQTAALCEINAEGEASVLWEDDSAYASVYLKAGWMREGCLCATAQSIASGTIFGAYYKELNVATGEILKEAYYDITKTYTALYYSAAYDSAEDAICGFGMNPDFYYYPVWKKSPGNGDLLDVTNIKNLDNPMDWCPVICYNETEDTFYGISFSSQVFRISKDGKMTLLFDIPFKVSGDETALAYVPATGKYLWNATDKKGNSMLYALDMEAGSCEKIMDLPSAEVYNFFLLDVNVAHVASAARVESYSFPDGKTEGDVTFLLPSTFTDGAELSGDVEWTATVDGVSVETGKAAAGDAVTVRYSGLTDGEHVFGMSVSVDGNKGMKCEETIYVGNDIPLAPEVVELEAEGNLLRVDWSPVDEGVHGGWIDESQMKYLVFFNDEYMATTDDTSYVYELPEDTPLRSIRAVVVAECNGLQSEGKASENVICGQSLSLPVYILPTQDEADLMTIINDNPGKKTWSYNTSYAEPCFSSGYHSSSLGACDDWLITPPIVFPSAEAEYSLSFLAARGYWKYYDEYLEVYVGTEPTAEGMTQLVMEKFAPEPCQPEYEQKEAAFTVSEPGTYYIGFRCLSEPDLWSVLVRSIMVDMETGVNAVQADGEAVVCTPDGRVVKTVKGTVSAETLQLPAGLYIVSGNGTSSKILVK